ncbi:Flagellar basal-body rod protein FlgG [Maioricimonas rarisocia]|uniref:Flagellar basal-body rod protein FlgG n=1 Tax=Maioricimonas rarisocia TaxID=2528026 RepID=A0A517ZCQ1_9PLAN|nr:flagellar hook basal-body protein [Maioricimonas rarisocia]QDU40232.1 Flagellar basal-body rod protein FlgG [Maioricimonas rarisocia]
MITGVYSAMTAMDAAASQHEVIAQNLAHAQMPGYRRMAARHQSFEAALDAEQQAAYSRESMGSGEIDRVIDFSQGTMERTGRTLDFAIHGEGFFVVDSPDGEALYTRNGSFHLNGDGELITAEGLNVRGANGIINVPPDIDTGSLSLLHDGTLRAGEREIGQLALVQFEDKSVLERRGVTLFAAPPAVNPGQGGVTVVQGTRERSNVQPVHELVRLIAGMRQYEAAQKTLQSLTDAVKDHIQLNQG